MKTENLHIKTIGLVLSYVPGYSETFFKNKILGLQKSNYRVILFVDYKKPDDYHFECDIVYAPKLYGNTFTALINGFSSLIKAFILYPKKSINLYKLDKRDDISFTHRIKNIILNQFLFTKSLDWLHFGFGMHAIKRENVACAIGAKMAVSFRGSDLYLTPLKHNNCYDLLFTKAVKYHVLSQEMKQTLIAYQVNEKLIQVITPAIDVHFFKNKSVLRSDKNLRLTTVARLHWKKGLEYTLEALSLLKKQGIDFTLTIIGDGEERERLIFAAHQLGIIHNVEFKGQLNHDEVKEHLQNTDIYLQYSIQEGFCNAVLEAQAMGLLCIVSNAEGLAENVLDGKTGWVVPKRQPKLLAQKIEEVILLSSQEKQNIREAAISRVRQEFNLESQNKAFAGFYND
ncbi:glycosyltransferase family 4 protein [Gaetbulibacter sp. M235]|uniref:glycosyltransferase family 4 protein n=1 Tax=Gaetbulibacter sp. M235 TaxID=3126510 RepID=UPI00374E312E